MLFSCEKDTVSIISGVPIYKGMIGYTSEPGAYGAVEQVLHLFFPKEDGTAGIDLGMRLSVDPKDFKLWPTPTSSHRYAVQKAAIKNGNVAECRKIKEAKAEWFVCLEHGKYYNTIGIRVLPQSDFMYITFRFPVLSLEGRIIWNEIRVKEDRLSPWTDRINGSDAERIAGMNSTRLKIYDSSCFGDNIDMSDPDLKKYLLTDKLNLHELFKRKEAETMTFEMKNILFMPEPQKIFFRNPTTIVFWKDGTVTSVRCSKDDVFTEFGGYTAALAKKMYGNHSDIAHAIEKARAKDTTPVAPPPSWVERNKKRRG